MPLHKQPRIRDMRYAARDNEAKSRHQQHNSPPPPYFDDRPMQHSPTSSVESYVSTVDSEEDQPEDMPEYDVPEYTARSLESSALAATPSDFSELFPSSKVLQIRHDDSTIDGNMNLRIDTEVDIHGRICDMTLFHLRMQDLKYREFSLRRYHRNSGREVCHSVRKHQKSSADRRPGFHRSLSNALQNMRPRLEQRSSTSPTMASLKQNDSGYASMHSASLKRNDSGYTSMHSGSLKRNDSGYTSMHSSDLDEDDRSISVAQDGKPQEAVDPNSVRLEFSNYAQVEVKRVGAKGSKRYEFEYWGVGYAWKRVVRKDSGFKQVAFHLTKTGGDRTLAVIEPLDLDGQEAKEERLSGGWIPPCEMQITDDKIIRSGKDVADSVVAAGLVALVDDSIRRHFHSEETKQLIVPVPRMNMGVEYIGPKRLINEMFNRKDSSPSQQSRPSSSSGPSAASVSAVGRRRPGSSRQSSREYR